MEDIEIRQIGQPNSDDINLKNEPFRLFGRMLPAYQDGQWRYTLSRDEAEGQYCFPDELYSYEEMAEDHVFLGAYDGPVCVGLAILRHSWNRYLYLHDLKVCAAYRGRHIATALIHEAFQYALQHGYRGLWTVGQDNNLAACLLYINTGFRIGGIDTEVYLGTPLEGNADIHFYKDA